MVMASGFQPPERCLQLRKVVMRCWKRLVTQQRVQAFWFLVLFGIEQLSGLAADPPAGEDPPDARLPLLFPLPSQADCDRSMAAL